MKKQWINKTNNNNNNNNNKLITRLKTDNSVIYCFGVKLNGIKLQMINTNNTFGRCCSSLRQSPETFTQLANFNTQMFVPLPLLPVLVIQAKNTATISTIAVSHCSQKILTVLLLLTGGVILLVENPYFLTADTSCFLLFSFLRC